MRFTWASRTPGRAACRFGQPQQFVIRHRTPEEVAQSRCQLDFGDRVDSWTGRSGSDRARPGTGSGAIPASPEWRAEFPARRTGPLPSPSRRIQTVRPLRLSLPAGDRRDAPSVETILSTQACRRCSDRRSESFPAGFFDFGGIRTDEHNQVRGTCSSCCCRLPSPS